ncbi:hypothetical protein [Streptomyces sp. NPDC088182]|uniref:hypothetical protein n=1 Tax=Streptomyces sp. NPDC088182 TaxID=3365838 RepID=UPI00382E15F1
MTHQPMSDPPSPYPRPASSELIALATVTRPDWDPFAVREALAHAHVVGMSWGQVLAAAGRLMADPDAEPADLLPAVPEPWRHRRPSPGPETAQRGAAAVRAALNPNRDTH